ncbi:MAG: serine protease [Planctomycetota bacterium]
MIGFVGVALVGFNLLQSGGGPDFGDLAAPGPASDRNGAVGDAAPVGTSPSGGSGQAGGYGGVSAGGRYTGRTVALKVATNVYGATLTVVPDAIADELAEKAAAEAAAAREAEAKEAEADESPEEAEEPKSRIWPGEENRPETPADAFAVDEADEDEWPRTHVLTGDTLEHEFRVQPGIEFRVTASFGPVSRTTTLSPADDVSFDAMFEELDMQRLRKAATCQIRMPGGGFGSGFLYGDRRTIATAAHCVAARDVGDLLFVFAPSEPDEETVSGAELVYFDAKQDVALLTLSEPIGDHRPYFLSLSKPSPGIDIVILGNPGRSAVADPTYARSGAIADVRPDEFSLDIEVKPGYSGGPVVKADTFDVLGITSFKIIGGTDYENLGRSYAKGADIAGDAYSYWWELDDRGKADRVERETTRYTRDFGLRSAREAASNMLVDSAMYYIICVGVVGEYVEYHNREVERLPPMSRRMWNKKVEEIEEEFLKERAPRIAQRTKERVTPKLRLQTMSHYEAAMSDEGLDELVKSDLTKLHEKYSLIKEAAETIADPGGKSSRGRSAEEFLRFLADEFDDVRYFYSEVAATTASVTR